MLHFKLQFEASVQSKNRDDHQNGDDNFCPGAPEAFANFSLSDKDSNEG